MPTLTTIQADGRSFSKLQKPIFVWRTYLLFRDLDMDVPEWVLQHFDIVAANLELLVNTRTPKKGEIAPGIYSAMGFAPGGAYLHWAGYWRNGPELREAVGAFNPLTPDADRDFQIAESVSVVMSNSGRGKTAAVSVVAKQYHVSPPTVWRALRLYPQPKQKQRITIKK